MLSPPRHVCGVGEIAAGVDLVVVLVAQASRSPGGAGRRPGSRSGCAAARRSCAAAAGTTSPTRASGPSPTGRRPRPAGRCATSRRCRRTAASSAPSMKAPMRGDLVERREAVGRLVVGVAPRHALDTQPVLHQERRVEADEQQPEVDLAEPLVEHPPGDLRPPEVEAGEHREHHGAEHHVVEVRDHEVGVGQLEVERRRRPG